jgi:tryptophan halogenase
VQRVDRTEGEFGQVERRGDGGIAALLLKDGRRIEADLFLDCAGPSAPLLTAVGDSFEDWSAWLPADRLLLGELKGRRPSPVDGVEALDDGWRWTAPLAGKALVGFAYASAITDEQQARRVLEAGEMATIRTGRQRAPWVHNVLALGDAAVAVDPLEGVNLHLAQSAILRALELLPGRDCHPVELAEYNRRTDWATSRVRDFLALHYLRSGRREGCFWAELADRPPPETLALTLEQWERRGRLPFFEEESFDSDSWTAVLFGLGIMPRDVDPVADGVSLDQAVPAIARHAKSLAALAARLPAYPDYLEGMRRTPTPEQR